MFLTTKTDAYITSMHDLDKEIHLPKGFRAFHITSDKQTKWLDSREICIYHPDWQGVYFGYEGDWE